MNQSYEIKEKHSLNVSFQRLPPLEAYFMFHLKNAIVKITPNQEEVKNYLSGCLKNRLKYSNCKYGSEEKDTKIKVNRGRKYSSKGIVWISIQVI